MRIPRPLLPLSLLPLLVLAACSDRYDFDEGPICLADPAAPVSFQPGDDLEFKVILDPCMGCADSYNASCNITRDGDRLIVDAHGTWIEKRAALGCTDVCLELAATCIARDLEPGSYKLVSGSYEVDLTLPSAAPVPQADACTK